jgi:integrase|tara:strand:+ start:5395 stop:6009 length:615 start_codon:yes stop_codon:yes gene_type:complete
MKSILYKAVEWDQLLQNPLRKIKLLKEDDAPAVFFTTDELDQLIAAADPMIARMIIVAAYTGMRLGKITGLLWKHIDYANNYITEENPKNSRGRRIRMHPRVAGALRSQPRYLFSEIVFPSLNLTPISEMATYFKRAMKKAGINKKATFHTLKHTFASHLAMNGVPLITIKELLGHSSLNMVQRYAHLSPQHLEGAIDSLYTGS